MKFSLNNLAKNIDGPATNGNRSKMTQEIKSTNADTNIQINPGTSGSLVIKNTAKLLGGLALAAMVAMAATFGSFRPAARPRPPVLWPTAPTRWTSSTSTISDPAPPSGPGNPYPHPDCPYIKRAAHNLGRLFQLESP